MKVTATVNGPETKTRPYPPEPTVTLTMPMDVARTIACLVGDHSSGDDTNSYRMHTDLVFDALDELTGRTRGRFTGDVVRAVALTEESAWRHKNE